MFGGNYTPIGWALCNGQLLSISGNEVLYTLLGTTYGG
ncbi:tail fiber protein, partial [Acinetobacter baumannii]